MFVLYTALPIIRAVAGEGHFGGLLLKVAIKLRGVFCFNIIGLLN